MVAFSNLNREEIFEELTHTSLDLLVIGGGITGSGIALDAASRGIKTGLVEMQDFAAGTSSRSTKLVHGGLRYLKQFEVKMVAEVGKERAIVYENGPHVTTPEWMMLPFHEGGTFGPFTTSLGLRVYDFLAGVKKSERRSMFSAAEALQREPLVKRKGLKGAGFYVEYKTDDARLTLEVLKKAVEYGARAVNYTKVTDFIYDEKGKLAGVVVKEEKTGKTHQIYAKKIINAAGPWVDTLREKDGSNKGKRLLLTKGVHLVFDQEKFPLTQAVYFDAPDDRMIFAIPREGKTYVGTTDTAYEGEIAHPTMTVEDRDYLLNAIHYMFPEISVGAEDVESSWAGLRPLIAEEGKKPGEISRKDEIFISKSGLISMAGGKLTGYRKMAENVVDMIVEDFKQEQGILYSESETKHLPVSGGEVGGAKGFATYRKQKIEEGTALGMTPEEADYLVRTYGSNVNKLFDAYADLQNEAAEAGLDPYLFSQLYYALHHEMVYKPVDFFVRRTGALFFQIETVRQNKQAVTGYMEKVLHWTEEQRETFIKEIDQLLHEAVHPAV
ncbi:glycerol-3-phosphate dehydrogenase/oxidase [Sediminibacillus massiliensis]|uniref:glycerol-3-phosphate dehydrogenase/oxidase n=1 Tax=Sediminibacillus massiliensis TaxID=1926277 RepID=UPI00098847C0|nr:FAD-dependent oxidoreductase [Sediminibacillus massiliensis]